MVELISSSSFKLYLKYALRDLSRSYSKILSIIITLFISLFILSTILTIEDSLETEIKNNSKLHHLLDPVQLRTERLRQLKEDNLTPPKVYDVENLKIKNQGKYTIT